VPLTLAEKIIPAINHAEVRNGKIHIGNMNADKVNVRAILDALKTALKSVTGKDVALNVKVDPSIIGGLVVKLGSRMVDSSLRTKLNSIKHAMKEAG